MLMELNKDKQLSVKKGKDKYYIKEIGFLDINIKCSNNLEYLDCYKLYIDNELILCGNTIAQLKNYLDSIILPKDYKFKIFVNDLSFLVLTTNIIKFSNITHIISETDINRAFYKNIEFNQRINAWSYEKYKSFNSVASIPNTVSGDIKNQLKRIYDNNKEEWKAFIGNQMNVSEDLYEIYRQCLIAGSSGVKDIDITHKNCLCYDIKSSFPFVQLTEKYPAGMYKHYKKPSINLIKSYAHRPYIVRIKINNLQSKNIFDFLKITNLYNYINVSTTRTGIKSANECTITLTCIDYELLKEVYDCDSLKVLDLVVFEKWDYLPESLRKILLKLWKQKENNPETKTDINCIWGIACQKKYNQSAKKFYKYRILPFSLGLFTLSYSRKRLYNVCKKIIPIKYHTDSVASNDIKITDIIKEENKIALNSLKKLYNNNEYMINDKFIGMWKKEYSEPVAITNFGIGQYIVKSNTINKLTLLGCLESAIENIENTMDVSDIHKGYIVKNAKRIKHNDGIYRTDYVIGGQLLYG